MRIELTVNGERVERDVELLRTLATAHGGIRFNRTASLLSASGGWRGSTSSSTRSP